MVDTIKVGVPNFVRHQLIMWAMQNKAKDGDESRWQRRAVRALKQEWNWEDMQDYRETEHKIPQPTVENGRMIPPDSATVKAALKKRNQWDDTTENVEFTEDQLSDVKQLAQKLVDKPVANNETTWEFDDFLEVVKDAHKTLKDGPKEKSV